MELPVLAVNRKNKHGNNDFAFISVERAVKIRITPENQVNNRLLRVVGKCKSSYFNTDAEHGETCDTYAPIDVRQIHDEKCAGFERIDPSRDTSIGETAVVCYLCKHWNGISLSEARMLTYYLNKPSDIISPIIMKKFIGYAAMERGNILPTTKAVIDRFNDLDFRDYDY